MAYTPAQTSPSLANRAQITVGLLAMSLASAPLAAQPSSSSGHAQAEIVTPITVQPLSDLSFGRIAVSPVSDGSVSIDPASGQTIFAGSARRACGASSSCGQGAATFRVTGEAGRSYTILVPGYVVATAQEPGMPQLTVEDLSVISRNDSAARSGGLLDTLGADQISLGGTLRIPAGTPPATFRAQVSLVVTYS